MIISFFFAFFFLIKINVKLAKKKYQHILHFYIFSLFFYILFSFNFFLKFHLLFLFSFIFLFKILYKENISNGQKHCNRNRNSKIKNLFPNDVNCQSCITVFTIFTINCNPQILYTQTYIIFTQFSAKKTYYSCGFIM